MKSKMMSKHQLEYLFDHILDGFKSSYNGIINLEHDHLVSDAEIEALLKKNSERLIDRIKEFRLTEKLLCIFFAALFGYMQITGEDLEMRRTGRTARGRRRHETEQTI